MAKINHLEMTENLMALNDIEVKKRLHGLDYETCLQANQQRAQGEGTGVHHRGWQKTGEHPLFCP